MRNPNGIRVESAWSPNASRAGALHSHSHSHIHRQNLHLTFANADTCEALASDPLLVAAGLRDAGEEQALTRCVG